MQAFVWTFRIKLLTMICAGFGAFMHVFEKN